MMRMLICSFCGAEVHPRDADDPTSPHTQILCGTWATLVEELERLHRLEPETIETYLRHFFRDVEKHERDAKLSKLWPFKPSSV